MNKLVLFDIDGTLVYHVKSDTNSGSLRITCAIKKVFGIDTDFDNNINYNGWIDPMIIAHNVKPYGISTVEVQQKMPLLASELHKHALEQTEGGLKLYRSIPEAVTLANELAKKKTIYLGLLTGNVEKMARWKLEHAGISDNFKFGLFGEEADDRIRLAQKVFTKAKSFFKISFRPEQIVVVGDALPDIRCAQVIGAKSVIAMTGNHTPKEELQKAGPTLLVDTLLDKPVLTFFDLTV